MIKEIRQIIDYDAKNFLKHVIADTEEMQSKSLEVEIQYSYGEAFTALLIGRKQTNGSSKAIR